MNLPEWCRRNRLELQAAGIIAALFAVGVILVDGPMIPAAAWDNDTTPYVSVATAAVPESPIPHGVEAGTATSPPVRLESVQATPTLPPPLTPQQVVNALPYAVSQPGPAMEAYRIVAAHLGWSAATIEAWAPFAEDVMYGESQFCWNRIGGDAMVYPPDGCRKSREGHSSDAGFGQVTPIAGYRSDLWMCQEYGMCSKWDIVQDPWHSMLAMVLLMEREGRQPWCYDDFARKYHDCTLAPAGRPGT